MTAADDLRARAEAWLAEDPDADTRAELTALLAADDAATAAELADRFAGFLQFGTAGLRGALGAGPNRMNRAVVIGFDARHKSDLFAHDTAMVMSGLGLPAMVLPEPLPTPVLAFAIRHLGAAAGVMVTASHNPPQDNGYKVYLGDGSQIVPPADAEIASAIANVGALASIPRGEEWITLDEDLIAAYLDRVASLPTPGGPRDLVIAYTPMHGVGGGTLTAAFERAGFPPLLEVTAQSRPDPDFPTVAFPNPEEPGAMDLALAAARAGDADLVIANDPDADRCAVAVPDATADGGWRALRGDEVGVLLGAHLLDRGARGTFANSIVSGSLLARLCEAAGVRHEQTLTGFKWIAKVPDLAFGYEEALGYCVDPEAVNDKDGVSAALLIAELAAQLKSAGRTLLDRLDDLAVTHGVHATDQLSLRMTDLAEIPATMNRLRQSPPSSLGGRAVTTTEDLADGAGGLPPTDGLRFTLTDGGRVIVRPSGTEPKLKCYLEVVVPVSDRADLPAARSQAAADLAAIKRDLAAALARPSESPTITR